MATTVHFQKAVKFEAKGRVALIGPAGSGKSFTMLVLARLLAGPTGKIAAVDSEHGSLSKYAHSPACPPGCNEPSHFDFDVLELNSFSPETFQAAHDAAVSGGYDVFCCDSLTHFWVGKDGALEFVDEKSKKYKDGMGGWKEFRPHERKMVDTMVASPCHVICTMRTKTAYEEQEKNGKKVRVKIGLAPVQREGLEYEFDLVGYMDDENTFVVDKTRCSAYSGRALTKPDAKAFTPFQEWLKGAARPAGPPPPPPPPAPSNGNGNRPNQKDTDWKLEQDQLSCRVYDVQKRPGAKGDFVCVKHNGEVNGKNIAFCFHSGLFDVLIAARGLRARLQVAESGDYINITDVIEVDGVSFIDGKPVIPGTTVTPEHPITDADIPF